MSDIQQAVVSAGVTVVTVGGWVFDKLPPIAAGVALAFTLWQWRRMVKRDRLEQLAKETGNGSRQT